MDGKEKRLLKSFLNKIVLPLTIGFAGGVLIGANASKVQAAETTRGRILLMPPDQNPVFDTKIKKAEKTAQPSTKKSEGTQPIVKQYADQRAERLAYERHADLVQTAKDALDWYQYDHGTCVGCRAGLTVQTPLFDKEAERLKICEKKWADFYSKPEIDIRVVLGYLDDSYSSAVEDQVAKQVLLGTLTAPCHDRTGKQPNVNLQICDFKRSQEDAELLEKVVEGPDRRPRTIKLRLVASSLTASASLNEQFLVNEQKKQSQHARDTFMSGIEESDALFYLGHARWGAKEKKGGGPDFFPAVKYKNGAINYAYYGKNTPGIKDLTAELTKAKKKPKIFGVVACDSERWRDEFEKQMPNSGLILTKTSEQAYEVGTVQILSALDSILWKRCESTFNGAMNSIPGKAYDGKPLEDVNLTGFYSQPSK